MSGCSGHCCVGFTLRFDPTKVDDVERYGQDGPLVKDMVLDLGEWPGKAHPAGWHKVMNGAQPTRLYGCRHHRDDGRCGIYEVRPVMCQKFAMHDGNPCNHDACTSPTPFHINPKRSLPMLTKQAALPMLATADRAGDPIPMLDEVERLAKEVGEDDRSFAAVLNMRKALANDEAKMAADIAKRYRGRGTAANARAWVQPDSKTVLVSHDGALFSVTVQRVGVAAVAQAEAPAEAGADDEKGGAA